MERGWTRRRFLAGAGSLAGVAWTSAPGSAASRDGPIDRVKNGSSDSVQNGSSDSVQNGSSDSVRNGSFDPVRNGFGFRNWSSRDQYFETPPARPRETVRKRVRSGWRARARATLGLDVTRFPRDLVDAITTQVHTAIVQRAGTNGHCYGMVLTAQRYFQRPAAIPVDRRLASEINDPTVPVEEPTAPVYEEILE